MAIKVIGYRCPDCGGEFDFLRVPNEPPDPDRCPLCNSWMSDEEPPEEVFRPRAPGIRKSAYAKSVDDSYRAIEASSAARAEDAADQLREAYARAEKESPHQGDPAIMRSLEQSQIDEMKSGLKVTNMRDPSEMREGDTAAIMPSATEAAKRLSVGPSAPGFQQFAGKPANHQPGIGPNNAGETTRQVLSSTHSTRAAVMIGRGNMGSYTEK